MSKKICVIKTSLRYNSNSDQLADAFIQGAKEGGNSCLLYTSDAADEL